MSVGIQIANFYPLRFHQGGYRNFTRPFGNASATSVLPIKMRDQQRNRTGPRLTISRTD